MDYLLKGLRLAVLNVGIKECYRMDEHCSILFKFKTETYKFLFILQYLVHFHVKL